MKNTQDTQRGILSMYSRFWMSVLFLFVLDEVLRFRVFCTSVVQVVEQMNKKVDLTRLKELPTVRVAHFSSKAPTYKTPSIVFFFQSGRSDRKRLKISTKRFRKVNNFRRSSLSFFDNFIRNTKISAFFCPVHFLKLLILWIF